MKLFLVDGHALIFKMYYAFLGRPMVNSKGVDTSILFGFTKYLLELIIRERPTHMAVAFDPPGGTFRNEIYPAYKANRGETPQAVIDALEPLVGIVGALNVPVLMIPGFEADDVIGSAAKFFASDALEVYMVTPDKDYGQLVGPNIFQYRPGKSGSDNEVLGAEEVCSKWNISSPSQVVDMLAICGDSSDNVPGVQGVGPVGAAKLLARYSSVEGIYGHLDELTARQQDMFRQAGDHIQLSKTLVTIKTDIPLDVDERALRLDTRYGSGLDALMDEYEFPSLKRLVGRICAEGGPAGAADAGPAAAEAAGTAGDASAARPPKAAWPALVQASTRDLAADRVAINLVGDKMYVAVPGKYACDTPEAFRSMLEDPSVTKSGMGVKAMMNSLAASGISLRGRFEDIGLMHYLLNPESSHGLEALAMKYLGLEIEEPSAVRTTGSLFDDEPLSGGPDRVRETLAVMLLADRLSAELDATEGMRQLYDEIEEPLIAVLSRMERAGVKVDVASLDKFAEGLRRDMQAREAEVRSLAGEPELNVASPKQIGTVIFEKLALDPRARKPRSGNWPTDEQTLQELSGKSPIIDAILDYRGLRKLLSTYIEPFAGFISPVDGRIHTTFNQALTSTGRLSSSAPNLQNIPIRTDQGREIRRAFVASGPDSVMMSADYSQIELRLMAHLSADSHLVEAFRAGKDVHAATAAKIFRERMEDVTADQRRIAKTVNFGIMYGISAFGLSQRIRCSRQEAKKIIDDYFLSFPSIRSFINDTIDGARRNGYVETMYGRRRYIPDIGSSNATVRGLAERNAVNAPIQGTAADIIKLAMIAVDRRLADGGFSSRMVLQIHDELLLEVPRAEIGAVRSLVTEAMEGVIGLSVPLTVECNYGENWLDAH